jgi:phosphoglycolate phosphatase
MKLTEKTLLWDWNGTLLDDAGTCIDTMNEMLSKRGMPILNLELYKEVFGFPVIDYYRKIGFNFSRESFEQISVEFIDSYNLALGDAPLAIHARPVLDFFKNAGKDNVIVSAMRQDMLERSVRDKDLENYFTAILGIGDIYAASKSHKATEYVKSRDLVLDEVVFIGDTLHDYEVACGIGCRCILVADGHQSEKRLIATGAEVIPSLKELLNSIV